jgi:hypothetical protein
VRVWDWRAPRTAPTVLRHGAWVNDVAFAGDGRHVARAGEDRTCNLSARIYKTAFMLCGSGGRLNAGDRPLSLLWNRRGGPGEDR